MCFCDSFEQIFAFSYDIFDVIETLNRKHSEDGSLLPFWLHRMTQMEDIKKKKKIFKSSVFKPWETIEIWTANLNHVANQAAILHLFLLPRQTINFSQTLSIKRPLLLCSDNPCLWPVKIKITQAGHKKRTLGIVHVYRTIQGQRL